MGDDKLKTGRGTPPEDNEWQGVWDALEKAEKGWIITGPIHAVVSNWRALCVIGAVIGFINRADIMAALEVLLK
jgi:hypothetical protein